MTMDPQGVIRAVRNPDNVAVRAMEFAVVVARASSAVVY